MDGRIAKPLVVEAADLLAVEVLKVRSVGLSSKEVQRADFEVAEELAIVVFAAVFLVHEPGDVRVVMHQIPALLGLDEASGDFPQGCKTARVVEDVHVEPVDDVVVAQEAEGVVRNVAEEVDVGLDAPVEGVGRQGWVEVEESAVPATHGAVGR